MVITHLNRLSVEDRRARQEVCERHHLRATASGSRQLAGLTRWHCSSYRTALGSRTSCPFATSDDGFAVYVLSGRRRRFMASDLKTLPEPASTSSTLRHAHLPTSVVHLCLSNSALHSQTSLDLDRALSMASTHRASSGRTSNGFSASETKETTQTSVRAYREALAGFSEMGTMDIWYAVYRGTDHGGHPHGTKETQ